MCDFNIHKTEGIDANLSNNNDKVGQRVRKISLQMTILQIIFLSSLFWDMFCDEIFIIGFEPCNIKNIQK